MTDLPTYTLTRAFKAPRDLVWRCWTDPELLGRWYGPGVETVIHQLAPEVGGLWLHEMKMGPNSMYQRMEYTEVTPPERLAMLMSTADANWAAAPHPMMENWPRTLLTIVTFTEVAGGTEMVLTWTPHGASAAEIAAFAAAMDGLDSGWGAGMEIMEQILAELTA
ncbi:SRPBCC domain-containing protein [Hasllibacter sp. MH4015]|uniref:SRPBCC family protein n=1 Tax=Hasllibacter sp. MH4015 TaxID=2854029 RepID=UPI001CD6B5B0|nr:SRPBCC domain-containing protein [Hasllibacter sp. MH4015]